MVVWNIFYVHPYLGKWSNLTSIFFRWVIPKQTDWRFSINQWLIRRGQVRKLLCSITGLKLGKSVCGVDWGNYSLPASHTVDGSEIWRINDLGYINLVKNGRNYQPQVVSWISEPSTVPGPYLKRIFYRNVYDSSMGMGVGLLVGSLGISLDCSRKYSHSSFKMVVARRFSFLGGPIFKGYVSFKRRVTFQVLRLQCIFRENNSQLGLEWNKAQLAFACGPSSIWCQELGARASKGSGQGQEQTAGGFCHLKWTVLSTLHCPFIPTTHNLSFGFCFALLLTRPWPPQPTLSTFCLFCRPCQLFVFQFIISGEFRHQIQAKKEDPISLRIQTPP